ncbi:MAG: hypothetical protein AAFZ52_01395 [Bacteroidota bacterium]
MRILFWPLALILASLTLTAQQQDKRLFIFGHSLIDHRPPAIPTPSDETTVPHWLHLLATEAGHTTAVGGQYGFLPQHANVPPISQWGYDLVPGVWESDTEAFGEADVNTILLTAGNFMQWQGPDQEYPGDPGITPINATTTVFDWVNQQETGVTYFIYENWPDMAPYLSAGMPPTAAEFAAYNAYTTGDFHDWWLAYQDSMLLRLPELPPRMIPVGPTLVKLLTDPVLGLDDIPLLELYEDDAPHGRPSLYFLAALITYAAVYEEPAPASYAVPAIVHPDIRTAYAAINDTIWAELQAFNDPTGNSRVFSLGALPVVLASFAATPNTDRITLTWRTETEDSVTRFYVERREGMGDFQEIGSVAAGNGTGNYEFEDLTPAKGPNDYRLRITDPDGRISYGPIATAELTTATPVRIRSLGPRRFLLSGAPTGTRFRLTDVNGRLHYSGTVEQSEAILGLPVSVPTGVYFLQAVTPQGQRVAQRLLWGGAG